MKKVTVGVIGCGNISSIYLKNLLTFDNIEVAAVADADAERAKATAEKFAIGKACGVDQLLADPQIELVVNLTNPGAHADVNVLALNAGKHAYVEKPLAVQLQEGQASVDLAKRKNLLLGSAPETFLGGGLQTCRDLIDSDEIGEIIGASAFMMSRGHEHWHPNPDFYYQTGGGPMFDMGPYYLTALIHLIGPMKSVTGSARISFPERAITSEPKYGQTIRVETPTHIAGTIEFVQGAIAMITTSFDVMGGSTLPNMEIYGSKGTLKVPDPNTFGGPVLIRKKDDRDWKEVPLTHGYQDNYRGIGVADMAYAIRNGRKHRASGEMALHVLEAMHGFLHSAAEGRRHDLQSRCEKPEPMPQQPLQA